MSRSSCVPRRKFLEQTVTAGGTLVLLTQWGCATGSGGSTVPSNPAAPPEFRAPLADLPELQEVGGVRRVQLDNFDFFLVRTGPDSVVALENFCTHKRCRTDFDAEKDRFVCPCHGSEFDLEGNPLTGPATEPLRRFPVRLEDAVVIVQLLV